MDMITGLLGTDADNNPSVAQAKKDLTPTDQLMQQIVSANMQMPNLAAQQSQMAAMQNRPTQGWMDLLR